MASSVEAEKVLEAAFAGIPRVAQAIAETPAEQRAKALEAAERSYRQTVQDLGYEEGPVRSWVSAVMLRLQTEVRNRKFDEAEDAGSIARRTFAGRDRGRWQCHSDREKRGAITRLIEVAQKKRMETAATPRRHALEINGDGRYIRGSHRISPEAY